MATDFRIGRTFRMGISKKILAVFQVFLMINQSIALSVWMPQFLSGGHGRNIRHLPCVSRKTGEQGVCMFAYTCMKSNGTHLGTCIDRFYFGSCCKIEGGNDDLLGDNQINVQPVNGNQVSASSSETEIQNKLTTSLPNLLIDRYTVSSAESNTNSPTTHAGSSSSSSRYPTDKTEVDSAHNVATSTHFLSTTTEKIYVPIHSSLKPNKTENLSSSSGLFTTNGSSSSIFSELSRPVTQNQNSFESTPSISTTTPSYLLSTFQIVNNENVGAYHKPPSTMSTLSSSTPQIVTWTTNKRGTTAVSTTTTTTATPSTVHKPTFSVTTGKPIKPTPSTTTKKPVKPVKPTTTTRKPPTKKPTPKPVVKPTTGSPTRPTTTPVKKPVQTTLASKPTTSKPTAPVKKPAQPVKKPVSSTPKPPTATVKPTTSITKKNTTTTSSRPVTTAASTTTTSRPTTASRPTTTSKPTSTTKRQTTTTTTTTTTETVFTKPLSLSTTMPTTHFDATTFETDSVTPPKKPGLITGPYLTTFNYTTEGVKVTDTPTAAITQSTISNELSSSEAVIGSIPEAQEENTNVIFQEIESTTVRPLDSTTLSSSTKKNVTSVPFFPEATRPTRPPWIQIFQPTTGKPTVSTTAKPTTTTAATSGSTIDPVISMLPGVNTSDYNQVCGRRLFPQSRVVGGEKSTFGKWPWQISLRQWRTSTYLHKCGAALLNENWAITAAHCVENVPPSDLLLRLGEHDLSTEDEPFGFQERRVQIVASHPQFDPRTFEYDLALLRFYEPVKFQPNIIPVCVPEDSTNFVGQTAYVTGWGRLYEDGPLPSVLQEVSVPVINNTLCENMYRSAGYIEHIPEIFICAGWKKGGFDSCEGDSGGPMVIQRPDKRWLLAGIISWGIGCAEPNQPGVYTRISEFREWIHQILQF